jgi:hypothetical protein
MPEGMALALLQPVYDRFTEGFETAGLKAANPHPQISVSES